MSRRERLVVVGTGMAGGRLLDELPAGGGRERFEITVIGEEPCGNYNRILLSGVLSGSQAAVQIVTHPAAWYAENGITLHAGERVEQIDRGSQVVRTTGGLAIPYDRLVLATGSRAAVPDLAGLTTANGAPKPGVFVFRTLDDCRRIAAYAAECWSAAVIGGGLLGLEAAYGLQGHGVEVHLVQQSAHLMNRQLDPEAGGILAETVRRMGMRLHLETGTEAVLGEERVTGLRFTDGTVLPCDMVVLACGIRPNAELAAECGLVVERGIVVDDRLQTSDPHIYAVGECAQHRGEVYGVVAPLWEQVQVLAGHLTGRVPHGTYAGSRVSTRLKVAGVEVTAIGTPDARPGDEVVRFSEPSRGVYKKLVIRNGRLAGAILLGDGDRAPYLIQAFDRGTPLPHERAALLFDLGGKPGAIPVAEMEDDTTVCHCNGVSKGDIRQCALLPGGLHGVMQATRAGTGCGSCKTLVKALVDHCVREGRELAAV